MAEPPSVDGAVHRTVADALPKLAVPIVGAAGTVAAGGVVVPKSASTKRTLWLPDSENTKPPVAVAATPNGPLILAAVAGPPSPLVKAAAMPVPATVVITPVGETRRTRWANSSAIRKPPSGVGASPIGTLSCAAVAAPPSPELPCTPVPATVLMIPADDTRRTRLLTSS